MPKNNSKANRERRQADAIKRQAEHDKRSNGHQAALLDQRPGDALRERARLEKQA